MSSLTFSYLTLYARGFPPIMCFETHGVECKENPLTMETWPAMKKTGISPFGQLPLLECEHGVITQSQSIMRYVARKVPAAGGKDEKEGIISDMLLGLSEDLWGSLSQAQPSLFAPKKDPEGVKVLWEETLPGKLSYLEAFFPKGQQNTFTSSGKTIGELGLWSLLHILVLLKPTSLDKTPKTKAFYTRILNLPSTQKVVTGKTVYGTLTDFFVKAE